jgi:small-conductance mechanosensitive channel
VLEPLTNLLDGLSALEATVVVLALSLGGALVVEVVLIRTLLKLVSRTETRFDNIVIQELRLPLVVTIGLAGVYLLTQTPAIQSSTLITEQALANFFGRPVLAVIIVSWAWALNQMVNRVVEELKNAGSRFDFAPVFSNVWTIVVVVGTAAALLRLYEVDITPLLGAAGIAGIAVGFAAKDTVSNFFGGISLYFDDTYKIGDYVVLDSGESGTVVKVGVRSTTLLTRDEVLVTVPNSVLNAAKIINESAPQRRKRIRVPLGVGYGTDLDDFEQIVLDIAAAETLVLDSPKPRMRFRSFGDSALQYELLCWVSNPTRAARAKHELNRAIYAALTEATIEIPYPKRDVVYRNGTADEASTAPEVDAPVSAVSDSGSPRPNGGTPAASGSPRPNGDASDSANWTAGPDDESGDAGEANR